MDGFNIAYKRKCLDVPPPLKLRPYGGIEMNVLLLLLPWQCTDLRQKRSICNYFSTLLLCIVQQLQLLLKCIHYPLNSGDWQA